MSSRLFDEVLRGALEELIKPEEALLLLRKANSYENVMKLFKAACKVRREEVGDLFKFDGFIGSIAKCTTDPPCGYCSRSSRFKDSHIDEPLTLDEVKLGAELIDSTGTQRVELGGGTVWSGCGGLVIAAVKVVQSIAPVLIYG